jgi:hypothetical protein
VSGSTRLGRQLVARPGAWSGTRPLTVSTRWLRCSSGVASSCTPIGGATAAGHRVTRADVGFRLRVRITARNEAGLSSALSPPTGRIGLRA